MCCSFSTFWLFWFLFGIFNTLKMFLLPFLLLSSIFLRIVFECYRTLDSHMRAGVCYHQRNVSSNMCFLFAFGEVSVFRNWKWCGLMVWWSDGWDCSLGADCWLSDSVLTQRRLCTNINWITCTIELRVHPHNRLQPTESEVTALRTAICGYKGSSLKCPGRTPTK